MSRVGKKPIVLPAGVKVSISEGQMEVSSNNPETGEASESISIDYSGPTVSIGFNARYLMDFVAAVGTPAVRLGLNPSATGKNEAANAGERRPG